MQLPQKEAYTSTYAVLNTKFSPTPQFSLKKALEPEEQVSALIEMLKEEAKALQNQNINQPEGEVVLSSKFMDILELLERLEAECAKDPELAKLACQIRMYINEVLSTLSSKNTEAPEKESEKQLEKAKADEEEESFEQELKEESEIVNSFFHEHHSAYRKEAKADENEDEIPFKTFRF